MTEGVIVLLGVVVGVRLSDGVTVGVILFVGVGVGVTVHDGSPHVVLPEVMSSPNIASFGFP